jgi:hypothetical protein
MEEEDSDASTLSSTIQAPLADNSPLGEVISELKTHHTIKNGQKYRRGRILEILHVHVVLHVHVMLHIH